VREACGILKIDDAPHGALGRSYRESGPMGRDGKGIVGGRQALPGTLAARGGCVGRLLGP
jgi:hypothetical protein